MQLKSVVIVPPNFFGGEGDGSIDSVVNDDNFLNGEAEVQDADDADWDKDSGNQGQSKTSKTEQSDDDQTQEGDETEETDSSDDDEEKQDETEDDKFKLPGQLAKSYPKNVMEHFAKRLGATLDDLEGNQPLQKAVKQLVDNAIHDAAQQARLSELEAGDGEEQEESTEDKTVETAKTETKTPEQQLKEYDDQLTAYVKRVNDPAMVDGLVRARAASWGINVDDPKQMQALKDKGIDLHKAVEADTKAAVNLVNTMGPQFVGQWVESAYPGFAKMYENALHSQISEELRSSKEFAGKNLPEYGTADFNQKIGEVLKANPWIDQMVFTKVVNGQKVPVPQREQIASKYKVAFGLMAGQKPDQKVVDEALETGRREERKKVSKTKTATNLAPGKTSGNFGKSDKKLKGSGGGFVEEYEQRKGDGF